MPSRAAKSDAGPPRTASRLAATPETPLAAWARKQLPFVRELGVAFMMFVFAADLSVANVGMPRALRWERRPPWVAALTAYPHIYQSWSMFSPDAPPRDYMLVVDAVTKDGRHVDPVNEVASRVATLPVDDIPKRLGHDSFWCDYQLRISSMPPYHQALIEWILRYPERTGRAEDALVSFDVWLLEHASPKPGETKPTDVQRRRLLDWRAPPPAPPKPAEPEKKP